MSQRDRETPGGIPLPPAYPTGEPPELPGEFPFTRGIHPEMYRTRLWTMRQYAGFGTTAETNRRFRYLLAQGQTGLSVAFDLPTQIGYDSDHPLALGEVGKVGVPISKLDDMEALLDGIPLESVSISMTINSTAPILLAFVVALARQRGVPLDGLRGTVQNDMLKEFISRRTYRFAAGPSLRLVTDVVQFCEQKLPKWNPISVSGYHMREAGCTATQEIAFTLANAITYMELARERGVSLKYLGRRISFFWNAHNHFLEEIAKFRAARRLWARTVRERFGIDDPACARMRFHTQTAGSTLTAVEPENNVVRVTLQALAAVLGGTQSLHTNAMDEALGLPCQSAARTALRTQQVIAHESGVTDVADPLGGAAAIESLTDQLESGARDLIKAIDRRGGALRAVEEGYQQSVIEEEAYRHQRRVESGDTVVVAVNRFNESPNAADSSDWGQHVDPRLEKDRIDVVRGFKSSRDSERAKKACEALRTSLAAGENIMDSLIHAAIEGATLGEMSATLSEELGEYRE